MRLDVPKRYAVLANEVVCYEQRERNALRPLNVYETKVLSEILGLREGHELLPFMVSGISAAQCTNATAGRGTVATDQFNQQTDAGSTLGVGHRTRLRTSGNEAIRRRLAQANRSDDMGCDCGSLAVVYVHHGALSIPTGKSRKGEMCVLSIKQFSCHATETLLESRPATLLFLSYTID